MNKRSVLVRSVRTDGKVTSAKARCQLKGKGVRGRVAKRLCGIKNPTVKKIAKNKVRITAAPSCSKKLAITATVTAQKPGARATTWTKTWRVAKRPRIAC